MKHHTIHPDTYLGAALLLLVVTIASFVIAYQASVTPKTPAVCPKETKTCADGSIVTRGGDSCKFAFCPSGEGTLKRGITEEPFEIPATPLTAPVPKQSLPITKIEPLPDKGVACTMEVMLCSDGSFVGRSGPKCAFAPCPSDLELDSDR